ncbi:hypothetical protein PR202_ga27845 [Eleusine coracana subsp. coracana]|uniref:Uncharacterized protein n=1 Tax=Eleusine coracana subsp. coracana TaxID=191504 RepID=A0AAV5DIN9_ELECO|nr:hypothetical protein PR202_ga27845 [Eleusine coracana subsp. coracana]
MAHARLYILSSSSLHRTLHSTLEPSIASSYPAPAPHPWLLRFPSHLVVATTAASGSTGQWKLSGESLGLINVGDSLGLINGGSSSTSNVGSSGLRFDNSFPYNTVSTLSNCSLPPELTGKRFIKDLWIMGQMAIKKAKANEALLATVVECKQAIEMRNEVVQKTKDLIKEKAEEKRKAVAAVATSHFYQR